MYTKDETSETIVRNLHLEFPVGQNWLISALNNLQHHQNTQLSLETQSKLQIVIFLEFWVVFTVSSFVGNPVYENLGTQEKRKRCQDILLSEEFPGPKHQFSHINCDIKAERLQRILDENNLKEFKHGKVIFSKQTIKGVFKGTIC